MITIAMQINKNICLKTIVFRIIQKVLSFYFLIRKSFLNSPSNNVNLGIQFKKEHKALIYNCI